MTALWSRDGITSLMDRLTDQWLIGNWSVIDERSQFLLHGSIQVLLILSNTFQNLRVSLNIYRIPAVLKLFSLFHSHEHLHNQCTSDGVPNLRTFIFQVLHIRYKLSVNCLPCTRLNDKSFMLTNKLFVTFSPILSRWL